MKERQQKEIVAECNELMKKLVPELDSTLCTVPMKLGRWYRPKERMNNGTPCFIASAKENGIYQDYIWMPQRGETLPAGYYHLRTKESYIEICSRLDDVGPGWCGCWTKQSTLVRRKDKVAYKEVKQLMKLRMESDTPNDEYILRIHRLKHQAGMHNLVQGLQHLH